MKEEIGKRIKNIRESMKLTKEDFAKAIGISGQYLGIVERGGSCLSVEKLKVLCDLTNSSADYILFGKDIKLINKTKDTLLEFTDEQIKFGCETIEKIALFIKNTK